MSFSIIALIVSLLFSHPTPVHATYDPLAVSNNKFGIHIADTGDLRDAASLVNSSAGDWGYVTLVIQDGDRNVGKWQEIMNTMRRIHLIPIVRLATHPEGDKWKIPQKEDAPRWADFLSTLNWPVENRYVVLFNEPNHAKEWGGTINPEEYADVSLTYAKTLKEKSADFFILPAGFDSSATSDGNTMDIEQFIKRMAAFKPEFFPILDGWTSHSYPNPGFSGLPFATGKGTIASFLWELQFLNSLGISKPYPVFITETGWAHNQGKYQKIGLTPENVGNNLVLASSGVWTDPRIVAITPFLLNYQGSPFDNFSWKKLGSSEFHPQYEMYQKLKKSKGAPNQHESFSLKEPIFPDRLVTNSTYTLEGELENTGQGIVDPADGYDISVDGLQKGFSFLPEALPKLEPNEKGIVRVHIKTPMEEGVQHITFSVKHGQKKVIVEEKDLTLIPPPTITLSIQLGLKKESNIDHVLVLVYDHKDTLLHKFQDLTLVDGKISVTGLYNMIPGKSYRIVSIVPFYLPRQHIATLTEGRMKVTMKRLLPFDFNNDGTFNVRDVPSLLFTKPNDVLPRFF
jgi:hypothetical protein